MAESQKRKQTDWLSRLVRPSTPDFYGKATPLTAHERSEQIGGSVDDVHSTVFLVFAPGSKGDMDSRQAMEMRFG
ncbi:MAG: hypothetical protein ABTS16_17300 [Candidatus Accumulibacter phosphatis]|uniref:hypothetical protein n=1 Tax=Candidatus Accumulibacter TaxID=327159 RepID=UPI00145F871B|nr:MULTISPECIES: hypothetical protein [Candidatus Accumulibacter]